jgi:putative transposase
VETACDELGVSQRKACQALRQSRSTQRYDLRLPIKDAAIIAAIQKQMEKRPRFGYRRITVELRKDGWVVNFKRVYRIWRDHDRSVPRKRPVKNAAATAAPKTPAIRKSPSISTTSGAMIL